MGIDAGFDMVPRLSRETDDSLKWQQFIRSVRQYYEEDEKVQDGSHVITFKCGEHPLLPIEGHKFLRFSSKVSGGIATATAAETYILQVTTIAKAYFGDRVRFWHEASDQNGFYDWRDVHASMRTYKQTAPDPHSPQLNETDSSQNGVPMDTGEGPYEVMGMPSKTVPLCQEIDIPGRGRGLVAKIPIPKGTRILCEKPLFTVESMSPQSVHKTVAQTLKSLSKDEQRQFLSLHNNFPGKYAFHGIVKTNALPCGAGSSTGGLYANICHINHNCIPNAHNSWNRDTQHETIHAVKDILAGEEIVISYDAGLPSVARWAKLKAAFGFQCRCELCQLPVDELARSDRRREDISHLDDMVGDPFTMMSDPLESLRACNELLQLINNEYGDSMPSLAARAYYDVFQISAAHSDRVRASVFAERAYNARVICEGDDSPETQKMKGYMQDPSQHSVFGAYSKRWRSRHPTAPNNLDEAAFEKWLWRR